MTTPREFPWHSLEKKQSRRFGKIWVFLCSILVFASAGSLLYYQRDIQDWYFLRRYQPAKKIAQLAKGSYLSSYGKRLFYLQDPEMLLKKDFIGICFG